MIRSFLTRISFGISLTISVTLLLHSPAFSQMARVDSLIRELGLHTAEDTVKVNLLNELSQYDQWNNFYQSMAYARKALQIADRIYYRKGTLTAHYRIAHCYWALGDSDLAIAEALKSAADAGREHFHLVASESYRILAISHRDQQDYEKAVDYIDKAEQCAMMSGDPDMLSRVYNTAGVIQCSLKNIDQALAFYTKSLHIINTRPTRRLHLAQVLSNIGEIYGPDHKDNPRIATSYFMRALTAARATRNRFAESAILNNIGKMLIRANRLSEAEKYLRASLALGRELNVKRFIKSTYLSLIDLKVRQGKAKEATYFVEKYYDVRDSLLNEKKTRQIVEMETRFETEKKEQTIRLLEQEKRISNTWAVIWIAGFVFLLLFVVMIYRLQRLRTQKAKQMLLVQKTLNHQLQETDQLKSRFFANISHEFRTPLSLILAPVEEMIASSSMLVSDKNDLRMVRRNANRLLELVNQLLDLSKIDAGKMKLRMQNGGLQEFLTVLTASFDSLAETRLIGFKRTITIAAGEAWFDRDKLEKMLTNVLSNAFNFTGAGGTVTLSIRTIHENVDLHIEVSDTGRGIPSEDLPHVFSAFYQTRRIADENQPGTGLGLTLVAELVKLHQGTIDLKSELNVGTTISIVIPVRIGKLDFEEVSPEHSLIQPTKPKDDAEPNSYGKNEILPNPQMESILVVEDNAELRHFIASCFEDDFRIYQARDGGEALKMAIEKVPDLIISDIMMPKMDGNILTEKIKTDDRTSHIPVILLTAKTGSESRMDGYRRGADDYLPKPFSMEELRVRVTNLIVLRKKLASKYRRNLLKPVEADQAMSLDDKFMKNLATMVEANLSDTSFGVEQLAKEMCMSRTQLFRKVKALVDISPNELINDIRLQRAAEMIRFKTDSLTQIGYAVGYSEQSYFAKRFRRKFGVSPSEYASD